MASIEAIFSGTGDQVYPETSSQAVILDPQVQDCNTLDSYISNLEARLSKISGAESIAQSLTFNITYLATDISDLDKIKELEDSDQWGENFQLPTVTSPYIWKKTIVTFKGQESTETKSTPFYEIVTADTAEISQTLYTSKDNSEQPTIKYPQVASTDDKGQLVNKDNINASLDEIIKESNANNLNSWSKTPSEISAANPYGFIAVRTRSEGSWSKFSIALNAKWSYDSKLIIRYTVTSSSNPPAISRTELNPGSIWKDDNTSEFTGYLWMSTATSSNNNLIADSDKNYWSSPQLISVIK